MHRDVSVGNKTGAGTVGGAGSYNKKDPILRRILDEGSYVNNPAPEFIQVDSYVCSDGFFFWNSDGTVTPSV